MQRLLINHTNHPSANWSAEQKLAAEIFGEIVDIPFPEIPPRADESAVAEMVNSSLQEILKLSPVAVLCQGEFNYTFALVSALKANNIPVMAATSERAVTEVLQPDGSTKSVSIFRFVRFRRY